MVFSRRKKWQGGRVGDSNSKYVCCCFKWEGDLPYIKLFLTLSKEVVGIRVPLPPKYKLITIKIKNFLRPSCIIAYFLKNIS